MMLTIVLLTALHCYPSMHCSRNSESYRFGEDVARCSHPNGAAGSGGGNGGRREGGEHSPRAALCRGAAFREANIWNSEILHPQLSVLFTVHTYAIVTTIRIPVGDLIAGVGAATWTFASGGKHPRVASGSWKSKI